MEYINANNTMAARFETGKNFCRMLRNKTVIEADREILDPVLFVGNFDRGSGPEIQGSGLIIDYRAAMSGHLKNHESTGL